MSDPRVHPMDLEPEPTSEELIVADRVLHRQPRNRTECPSGECAFINCRWHLWTDREFDRRGRVTNLLPSRTWGDTRHTCALREAERGPLTLEQVGQVCHFTRERTRQIEAKALRLMARGQDQDQLRAMLAFLFEIREPDDIDMYAVTSLSAVD